MQSPRLGLREQLEDLEGAVPESVSWGFSWVSACLCSENHRHRSSVLTQKLTPNGPHARLTFTILAPSRGHRPAVDIWSFLTPKFRCEENPLTLTGLGTCPALMPKWRPTPECWCTCGVLLESPALEKWRGQRWPKCQQSHEISGATWNNCSKGWRKPTAKLPAAPFEGLRAALEGRHLAPAPLRANNSWQHLTISHHNVKITTSYSSYGRFMSFWDTRCHQISPDITRPLQKTLCQM